MLVVLFVAAGLALLPFDAAAVRLGGLSLLWWYAAVVAPGVAVVLTSAVLLRRRASDAAGEMAPPA